MDFVQILPTEISRNIFSFLSGEDLWKSLFVSSSWADIANDNILWQKKCVETDIDFDLERFKIDPSKPIWGTEGGLHYRDGSSHFGSKSDGGVILCHYAQIWGIWRWETVQNWESHSYSELVLETRLTSDYYITTNGDCLALSDGSKLYVFTKRISGIQTIMQEDLLRSRCVIRTIEMNKDYLVVLKNNFVVVYRTSDYKPYLLIRFVTGRLEIIRENIPSVTPTENSSVEFVLLNEHSLWIGEYLFIKSTVMVDLRTGEFREVLFPWKCTLMRVNENVIAVTESVLAVYSLSGEKSFELGIMDYNLLNTSNSVLALITDSEILIFNRVTGKKLGLIKKVFFEFHINYKKDLIYGISKTKERSKVIIEAISLLNGNLLWSIKRSGEFDCQIRQVLGVFLCYTFPHSEYLYLLDGKTGKTLHKQHLPANSWISFVSDLFLVWQTRYKVFIRFY